MGGLSAVLVHGRLNHICAAAFTTGKSNAALEITLWCERGRRRPLMNPLLFAIAAMAIGAFAIWHRSFIGLAVAAGVNAAAIWLRWPNL